MMYTYSVEYTIILFKKQTPLVRNEMQDNTFNNFTTSGTKDVKPDAML